MKKMIALTSVEGIDIDAALKAGLLIQFEQGQELFQGGFKPSHWFSLEQRWSAYYVHLQITKTLTHSYSSGAPTVTVATNKTPLLLLSLDALVRNLDQDVIKSLFKKQDAPLLLLLLNYQTEFKSKEYSADYMLKDALKNPQFHPEIDGWRSEEDSNQVFTRDLSETTIDISKRFEMKRILLVGNCRGWPVDSDILPIWDKESLAEPVLLSEEVKQLAKIVAECLNRPLDAGTKMTKEEWKRLTPEQKLEIKKAREKITIPSPPIYGAVMDSFWLMETVTGEWLIPTHENMIVLEAGLGLENHLNSRETLTNFIASLEEE